MQDAEGQVLLVVAASDVHSIPLFLLHTSCHSSHLCYFTVEMCLVMHCYLLRTGPKELLVAWNLVSKWDASGQQGGSRQHSGSRIDS